MSFDYYVAVHREKWPTAAAVQASLERLGYPLGLEQSGHVPFAMSPGVFDLPVVFEGRFVELEVEIEQATDVDDPESLVGYIARKAEPEFLISNGDYVLILTFRDD